MNTEFVSRLKLAIGSESTRGFAQKTGLSEGAIRNYLTGKSLPVLDNLITMANRAGVRPEWLATGELPMRPGVVPMTQHVAPGRAEKSAPQGEFLVPRLDVEASAGFGTVDQEEFVVEHIAFKPEWLRNELGVNLNSLVLIRARGDSMEPTIRDGDLLLIDHSQVVDQVDGIYLIGFCDRLMVKRVQFLLRHQITLISDNSAYSSIRVDLSSDDEVRLLGRVVWFGKRT